MKIIKYLPRKINFILIFFIVIIPIFNIDIVNSNIILKDISDVNINNAQSNDYWAIIFAVGIYKNNPNQNRLSMLEAADDLYDTLLKYDNWNKDNIHLIKGEQATGKNLIKELMWLINNEDKNDYSLIYLTTHGSPLKDQNGNIIDIPPKDESDGSDEILVMYDGFDIWYSFIWDDLLNFFLGMLQSKGVCLIVDSCYSGGFNDEYNKNSIENINYSFDIEFGKELASNNRVVLMSSEENTVSYGSYFSFHLIDGFNGIADFQGNNDDINSAEESFHYAQNKVDLMGFQHPTMLDNFPGEFPITF
jgi:hypothetical protein